MLLLHSGSVSTVFVLLPHCHLATIGPLSLRLSISAGTCMSDQELLDLACKVDHLSELIAALTVRVDNLDRQLSTLRSAPASFQLVTSVAPSSAASVAESTTSSHDYNLLAAEIPQVPDFVVRLCSSLSGSRLDFRARASRAWEAGWWAKFVLSGRLSKVRPSQPIELANTCYIILRAEGFECPLLCQRAGDYRAVVGNFQRPSVSHGFPSLSEAKAYCHGAGVSFPTSTYQWSSSQQ